MAGRRKKRKVNMGAIGIGVFVIAFLAILGVKTYQMKFEKVKPQKELIRELEAEKEAQEQRALDLEQRQEDVNSPEYIEDVAHSTLGLVHDDEIVFKETKEEE